MIEKNFNPIVSCPGEEVKGQPRDSTLAKKESKANNITSSLRDEEQPKDRILGKKEFKNHQETIFLVGRKCIKSRPRHQRATMRPQSW